MHTNFMITIDSELGMDVVQFYCGLYNMKGINIDINNVDNLFDYGYCIVNDKHYEIEIRRGLKIVDYVKTLLHELVHVSQTIRGEFDDTIREREAYEQEDILYAQFKTNKVTCL